MSGQRLDRASVTLGLLVVAVEGASWRCGGRAQALTR